MLCEGIETGLSLLSGLLPAPASVWAALSTSGMQGIDLPKTPGRLIVASDGDQPGRSAANKVASRAAALGWDVQLMPAPEGMDWNDVLVRDWPAYSPTMVFKTCLSRISTKNVSSGCQCSDISVPSICARSSMTGL
ncbi:MAG: toprim domain-containing protein [Pelagimonas sp.]|nr:toprim domain-containing protein [Pelagimonas sp.]